MDRGKLYKAIQFAAKAHEGQKRKGKNPAPYICHPIFVGMELLKLGYNEDIVIAGILHDVIEDGFRDFERSVVEDMIKNKFRDKVLNFINAVSEPKNPNMSKEEKVRTWESRKKAYMGQLKSATAKARAIASLDMYANMLELKQTLEEEGIDALKLFNVDMEKKLKHWQEELDLFAEDKGYPHSGLITEMENILKDIQELVKICKTH